MKKIFLVFTLFGLNAFSETAILCGNLKKIETSDKAARVHLVTYEDTVSSLSELKFFDIYGKKQNVIDASNVDGQEVVTLPTEKYIFQNRSSADCDGEQIFKVQIVTEKNKKNIDCVCYQD
jgi:hypothetical protein